MQDSAKRKPEQLPILPIQAVSKVASRVDHYRRKGYWPPFMAVEYRGPEGQRITITHDRESVKIRVEPNHGEVEEKRRRIKYLMKEIRRLSPKTDPELHRAMTLEQRAEVNETGARANPLREEVDALKKEVDDLLGAGVFQDEYCMTPLTESDFAVILPVKGPEEWSTSSRTPKQAKESSGPSPSETAPSPSSREASSSEESSPESSSQSPKSTKRKTTDSKPKNDTPKSGSSTDRTSPASETPKD